MASILQDIVAEVSDNWPAFSYLLLMTGFSIRFLCERRAETRLLKQVSEELRETICLRLDRLEYLIRYADSEEPIKRNSGRTGRFATVSRRS